MPQVIWLPRDGAITALTSSTCIDLLGIQERRDWDEARQRRVRKAVHLGYAALFLLLTLGFRWLDDPSMVGLILKLAGYTYGPLLALFAFGIFTKLSVRNELVPIVCIAAPVACYILKQNDKVWLGGYSIGTELLIINAAITFILLLVISRQEKQTRSGLHSVAASRMAWLRCAMGKSERSRMRC